jgi:heptosyltransferase-2
VRKGFTESSITCRSKREELLVCAPNWLGDAVMATPFLFALRRRLPAAAITLYCRSYVAEVFRRCPACDSLVEYERTSVGARISAIAARIPRSGYDACFVLPPSFSSALVSLFCRARRRIGYGGNGRRAFLTDALPASLYRAAHLSKAYVMLLETLTGHTEEDIPLPVVMPPDSWAKTVQRISNGKSYFVMAPGAVYGSSKVWPHERFAALATRLVARTGWMPVIVGRGEERAGASALIEATPVGGTNCAGALSLEELLSVLRGSSVTIGNDSGAVHLSAALGRPTVAIFGPSSAAWTAPRGRAVRTVTGEAECAPCFERECPRGEAACLLQVDVEDVYREACSLIEGVQ